jgi:8-oxo-dGTP diphosphatase
MREWLVAGAVVERPEGMLLVRNQRRNGRCDWSTPGGVIDADDATLLEGLAREVEEETGLRVLRWADLGWSMRCEVHYAAEVEGELRVDDPDGIVVDAVFVAPDALGSFLDDGHRWVREPLHEWVRERWSPGAPRRFHFEVRGTAIDALEVARLALG